MRRSQVSEETLPLGLHVLGLPLAFILSQDQTLHCMFVCPYTQTQFKIDALVFLNLVVICYVNDLIFFSHPQESQSVIVPYLRVQK